MIHFWITSSLKLSLAPLAAHSAYMPGRVSNVPDRGSPHMTHKVSSSAADMPLVSSLSWGFGSCVIAAGGLAATLRNAATSSAMLPPVAAGGIVAGVVAAEAPKAGKHRANFTFAQRRAAPLAVLVNSVPRTRGNNWTVNDGCYCFS